MGGFVKLFGEEYHEIKKKSFSDRAFINKKPWQKALIVSAGVIMNILLGVAIFYIVLGTNKFRSDPIPVFINFNFKFGTEEKKVIIANVNKDSPASKADIKSEDAVINFKIDDGDWKTVKSSSHLIDVIKNSGQNQIYFDLLNIKNGEKKIINVKPVYNRQLKRSIIGVNLVDAVVLEYKTIQDRLLSGFYHSYNLIEYNLRVISSLFSSAIKEKKADTVAQAFSGPIGIFAIIEDTVKSSGKKVISNLLNITGILSLSLALMNILPFPALDGGRMVFVLYEWITNKKSNKNIEKYVNFVGFIILISLGILISISDIIKLFR